MDTVIRVGRAKAELFRTWKKPADRALFIALTGGIGAGKSTVARAFEDLGAVVAMRIRSPVRLSPRAPLGLTQLQNVSALFSLTRTGRSTVHGWHRLCFLIR